jgi:hypothetical protein
LRLARITLWTLAGLVLPLALASGDELPPPIPIGIAMPAIPTWEQALDGDVELAQGTTTAPGTPARSSTPAPPTTPATPRRSLTASSDTNNPFASLSNTPSGTGAASNSTTQSGAPRVGFLQMIGDVSPLFSLRPSPASTTIPTAPSPFPPKSPPATPSPRTASALAPSVRNFKIAENQSPQPQDRVFYSFNYYYNLNAAVDKRFDTPINNLRAYREILGFEKTFDEGRASFGLVLPIDTLYATSTIVGNFAKPGGVSTSTGDMSLFTKFIVRQDPKTGSLISAGVVVTPPTGPRTFAGAGYISSIHTTTIQPYIGYILRRGNFYLHGFSAFEFPVDPNDVTLAYNDAGLGYFLYQDTDEVANHWLTAIVPTTEVHINTPLNHRDPYNPNDVAGSANVVNLTQGLNLEFNHRSIITFGIASPVTSPKPFDLEALVLFNLRFGRSRATLPPILGG